MLLEVKRPRVTTTGRTQSYRLGLRLVPETPGEEVALFVVARDGAVHDFDRVVEPWELRTIPTDTSKSEYRTDTLDLYVAAQGIADNLLRAVQEDLLAYARTQSPRTGPQSLSGATV